MENKHLGHVLQLIAAAQRERDEERLKTKRLTLREEEKLRRAMGDTTEVHARRKRVRKPPTYPPMQLTAAPPPNPDPLARVLAWAKAQVPQERSATRDALSEHDN